MPIHPLIVHFPIALLIIGAIVEIVNAFAKKDSLSRIGTFLMLIGVITGVVTLVTGDGAETFAYSNWGRNIHDTVELHSTFAGISMIIFGVITVMKLFIKRDILKKPLVTGFIIILSVAGIITLAITGHLGGKVVYEHDQLSMNKIEIMDSKG